MPLCPGKARTSSPSSRSRSAPSASASPSSRRWVCLPHIAAELDITVPEAGHAVSLYALGVVVGAPLITTIAAHMDRKVLLLCLMGLFALGNIASMLAPNPATFNIARFVSGLPHGAYLGIGAIVAASLVPLNRRGRAMARVMLGLTIANIVGVPVAAALGNAFGWRAPTPSSPPSACSPSSWSPSPCRR